MDVIRHAAVAGRFYPYDRDVLVDEVRSYLTPIAPARPALGCVVPHAGYVYSGVIAGAVYAAIEVPRLCLVLCPNHTGRGMPLAMMSTGSWETPIGPVPIDADLADCLKQAFPSLSEDDDAHRGEHAIEVQLPFLQQRRTHLAFVPIALGTGSFEVLEQLGQAVGEVLKAQDEPTLIVASSDMNHYESDQVTRVKDRKAVERILALDARGLYDVVTKENVSMCGFGPTIVMITAAKILGARGAELVKYGTSGDISGDRDMVVGYAGIVVR